MALKFNKQVPYVAYWDFSYYGGSVAVLKKLNAEQTAWETVGGALEQKGMEAYNFDINFIDNTPYVAYISGDGFRGVVKKLNSDGSGWDVLGSTFFSESIRPHPFVSKIDNNAFYVAYVENTAQKKLVVKVLNPQTNIWEKLGTTMPSVGSINSLSLVFYKNVPYLSFSDAGSNNRASLIRLNSAGNDWEFVGDAGFSSGPINSSSLAVYNDDLFISYSGADGVYLKKISPSVLPVSLLAYSVKTESNAIKIDWSTASELNSSYFCIERSNDGKTFTEIQKIKAAGISSVVRRYSATDFLTFSGDVYYRLSQTDLDGKTTVLGIKKLQAGLRAKSIFNIYPNPSAGTEFMVSGVYGLRKVRINNSVGKIVYQNTLMFNADTQIIQFDGRLAPGVYVVEIEGQNKKKVMVR